MQVWFYMWSFVYVYVYDDRWSGARVGDMWGQQTYCWKVTVAAWAYGWTTNHVHRLTCSVDAKLECSLASYSGHCFVTRLICGADLNRCSYILSWHGYYCTNMIPRVCFLTAFHLLWGRALCDELLGQSPALFEPKIWSTELPRKPLNLWDTYAWSFKVFPTHVNIYFAQ